MGGRRVLIAVLAVAVGTMGVAAGADAKKKKKKKVVAVTKSAAVPFGSNSAVTGSSACTGKTHMTGGGYAISPSFTPPSTGLRSSAVSNHAAGSKTWTTGAGAFVNPSASGSLTSYVRCEGNKAGQLVVTGSSTVSYDPGVGGNSVLNCPPGTHVISGGYEGTGIANFASPNGYRIIVLQSRRTGAGQWTVTAYNNPAAGAASSLTAYATCERNAKGKAVSEVSALAPLVENGRSSADATCSKKAHVVSGGFNITPNGAGQVPAVGVDETLPGGRRGWHVALHDFVNVSVPAGAALQTYAYCKKG